MLSVVLMVTMKRWLQSSLIASLAPLLTVGHYYVVSESWHLTQVEGLVGLPMYLAVVCVDTGVLGPRRATVRLRGDGRTCAAVQVHVPADLAGLLAHGHRLYGPSTGVGLARCRVRSGPDHRGLARPARGDGRVLRLDRHPRPRLLDVVRLPEAGGKGDPGSQRAEASGRNAPGCDYTASAAPSRLQWLLTTPREGGSGSIQAERAGCRASPDRSLLRRPWPALRRRPGRTT
jgi:hypothetical protein